MILKLNQTNMADVSESKWNQISTKCNEQSTSTKADSFTGKGITSLSRIALNVINKCYSVHNIFPYYFINTLYKQLYYIYPMRSFRKCWSTFRTRTFSVWLLLWKDILSWNYELQQMEGLLSQGSWKKPNRYVFLRS